MKKIIAVLTVLVLSGCVAPGMYGGGYYSSGYMGPSPHAVSGGWVGPYGQTHYPAWQGGGHSSRVVPDYLGRPRLLHGEYPVKQYNYGPQR